MRSTFVKTLQELAAKDERVMLLTADLGFMVVDDFARLHPDRFINVGVAEANMIGMATGLAARGMLPFCYSIATFASMRGYEQLRNGPVLHGLPVRVIGVGGGFAYGTAGITHHALEDLGLARLQPGLAVMAPGDDAQARQCLLRTYALPGPAYYRIAKDSSIVPALEGRFRLGRLETIERAGDLLLLTTGAMATPVLEAAHALREVGQGATVSIAACLSPAPLGDLVEGLAAHRFAVTVEDHYVTGGLGSLAAEVIAENGLSTRLLRLGVRNPMQGVTGSEAFLRDRAGLSVSGIVAAAQSMLAGVGSARA
jgi:transketolase